MKQFFYLAFCIFALSACSGGFKKGEKGLEYKIIANGSGATVAPGDFIQMHVKQVYSGAKDTVLQDSHDFMPRIQIFDSVVTPIEYFKILRNLRKGDSAVIRMSTDSLFANMRQQLPPFIKKGKFMYTHISILNIFKNREQADSANVAEGRKMRPILFKKQMEEIEKEMLTKNKEQIAKDDKIISDYLAKNNIKAQKTKWGTYISIQNEGVGNKVDLNSVVAVNYTGKTLDSGLVFDSNTDPKFPGKEPYEVKIWEVGSVILGWTDALLQLKKDAKATIYIPSSLGYGPQGSGDKIKANEILVFDIEIKDNLDEDAFTAKQQQMQNEAIRKMQEAEKAHADSVQKATKK